MRPGRFSHFAAVDWSGAVGERHRGIAVAICAQGSGAPRLVKPGHRWSRQDVLDWLVGELPDDTLVGCDLGTSFAFCDKGAFFPGWNESPADARALWALVDRICAPDPHLAAASFVDHKEASRHFRRHGGREGDLFGGGSGRLRITEAAQRALGCKPYSNFNLIGAAQVGKSSLTGMRMLNRLSGRLALWPFDPITGHGSILVEIYTTIAAMAAGRTANRSKIRSFAELETALAHFGAPPPPQDMPLDDHQTDALVAAAWLRRAAHRTQLWHPIALTAKIAKTEGWTFGAV